MIDGDNSGFEIQARRPYLTVSSIYRDLDSLKAELATEQGAMR
ncbi:MAG: hypothetical protein QOD11_958 [Bradyrhizobium sp.]|jgi:hypothetical protein|nr:hypothetical protein [Bradyrhizobium sp.]